MSCSASRLCCHTFLAFVCAASTGGSADQPPATRINKPGPGEMVGLALTAKVQSEIGIDKNADVLEKLRQIGQIILKEKQEVLDAAKGDQDRYPESVIQNIHLKHKNDVKELLTPDQFKRLQQIHWQSEGPRAMTDPAIVDALKLSERQIKGVVETNREFAEEQREYFAGIQTADPKPAISEIRQKIDDLVKKRDERIEQILSASQRDQFSELLGMPFKFK